MTPSELHAKLILNATRLAADPTSPANVEQVGKMLVATFYAMQFDGDRMELVDFYLNGLPPITDLLAECFAMCDEDEAFDQSGDFLDFIESTTK